MVENTVQSQNTMSRKKNVSEIDKYNGYLLSNINIHGRENKTSWKYTVWYKISSIATYF